MKGTHITIKKTIDLKLNPETTAAIEHVLYDFLDCVRVKLITVTPEFNKYLVVEIWFIDNHLKFKIENIKRERMIYSNIITIIRSVLTNKKTTLYCNKPNIVKDLRRIP